ncbi:MAG TPA: cation:proton antiporter [Flavobacteriales bacterium]|nr:cation:proton antiporter [Flavobacteriales bacterium]
MHHDLLLVIGLLFAVSLLTLLSPKLRIAYPILLVLGGLIIAFIPGIPHVRVDPELIFVIFLPPLLYEAAWFTSWREFWKWKRSITMLAFGLVFFTSLVIGYFTHTRFHPCAGFSVGRHHQSAGCRCGHLGAQRHPYTQTRHHHSGR